jgi:hypothetical protein
MKLSINTFLFLIGITTVIFSCKKNDGTVPAQQQILTYDTSGMTGQLVVYVNYLNPSNQVINANYSNVYLYASRDDIQTDLTNTSYDLAIYRINTGSDNSAYFGYINYGNYYVLSFNDNIGGLSYQKTSIVQVRPQQHEELTVTMTH